MTWPHYQETYNKFFKKSSLSANKNNNNISYKQLRHNLDRQRHSISHLDIVSCPPKPDQKLPIFLLYCSVSDHWTETFCRNGNELYQEMMQIVGLGNSLPSCCEMADFWGTDFFFLFSRGDDDDRLLGDVRPAAANAALGWWLSIPEYHRNQVSGGYWADSRWRGLTTPSCPTWHVADNPPCYAAILWAVLGGENFAFFLGSPEGVGGDSCYY